MADSTALTYVLVALAQDSDLNNSKISKAQLPPDARKAVDDWLRAVNDEAGEEVATFDNIAEVALRSSYSDDECEFYTLQFAYFFQDKIQGWLISQGKEIIGEASTST